MAKRGRRAVEGTPSMTMRADLAFLGLPAKQARSRVTRDRLLAAGRQLLDRGAFEATSIADIASAAGCSVGAFYHRFADKEAFFAVLLETVLADIVAHAKEAVSDERFAEGSIETTLTNCVLYWVQAFRRHQGLIRTVMKKTLHAEDTWTPVRRMGLTAFEPFIGLLAAKCGKSDSLSFQYRVLAGFQIVVGVMLNAALHRTILLNLESDELIAWANEIFRHCVLDDLPPALLALGATMGPAGAAVPPDPSPG
jgi:AcrR family transcriptional regulator